MVKVLTNLSHEVQVSRQLALAISQTPNLFPQMLSERRQGQSKEGNFIEN